MVFTEDEDLKSQTNYLEIIGAFKSRCHVVIIQIKTIQEKDRNLDWFNFLFWLN